MISRRLWIPIFCFHFVFTIVQPARAQISGANSAFLEYSERAQGPSDYIVKRFPNQKLMSVRLLGGVSRPGFYQIPENTSLLSLFSYSGGMLPESDISAVTIWREESHEANRIDLKKLLSDPQGKDISVRANDVIFIPEKEKAISSNTLTIILVVGSIAATILSIIAINDRFSNRNQTSP